MLLALAMFAATWPLGVWLRHRRRLRAPFPAVPLQSDEHAHEMTPRTTPTPTVDDCGHPAVRHGDHVDYVHDGHRHAPHGEHYDEH